MKQHNLSIVGVVHSCFKEKFGVPRQPGLVTEAKAILEIFPPYNRPEAFEGLQGCSHVWLQFIFHQSLPEKENDWSPTVRPPRLGGNKRMGVFATRSPARPNSLGLSVVKLEKVDVANGVSLHLSGVDLVDGTPVVDIKPYVPYADALPEAINSFANNPPTFKKVTINRSIEECCQAYQAKNHIDLQNLIISVLQQDPKPSYQKIDSERLYGMYILDVNVKWKYVDNGETLEVVAIEQGKSKKKNSI